MKRKKHCLVTVKILKLVDWYNFDNKVSQETLVVF